MLGSTQPTSASQLKWWVFSLHTHTLTQRKAYFLSTRREYEYELPTNLAVLLYY